MAVTGAILAVAGVVLVPAVAAPDEPLTLRLTDGVEMAYVEQGAGEPALVFVHCGNCQMGIWRETLDAFAPTHRVVAMDLPGHGRSAARREGVSIPALGADVAALVEHLQLRRVVLVGNSLGGPVALGIVAVDTLQNVEAEWPEESWRRLLEAYRHDFAATCDQFMLSLLPKGAPAAARERVGLETCANDAAAAIALLETLRAYDQAAALRAAGVPVWAINSTAFPTALEINRKYARSYDVILMEGVGHYPQVERPEEFQRHLRQVLQTLAAADPPPSRSNPGRVP